MTVKLQWRHRRKLSRQAWSIWMEEVESAGNAPVYHLFADRPNAETITIRSHAGSEVQWRRV